MKAAKVIAVLSAGCLIAGTVLLACTEYGYRKGRQEYALLQEKYISRTAGTEDTDSSASGTTGLSTGRTSGEEESGILPADAPQPSVPDWSGLQEESGDIAGWIELPAVGISYPVLQGEDNEFYLHHDIHGEYLFAGSIFLDSESSPFFRNLNTVIYGHNMRDGSMFARLKEYADSAVWEECPYFWIYTPEASILYRIGSVHPAYASGICIRKHLSHTLPGQPDLYRLAGADAGMLCPGDRCTMDGRRQDCDAVYVYRAGRAEVGRPGSKSCGAGGTAEEYWE